jgi:hypothetical protein
MHNISNLFYFGKTLYITAFIPVQTQNKRTSPEFSLVTAQSTAHEPPEDGRKYGPKHVGTTLLKCF